MARYAQGYERKNSDTKNLLILISIIVGVVCLAIGIAVLVNELRDFETKDYSDYEEYYVEDTKVLKAEKDVYEYLIYICEAEATSDSDQNMEYVIAYIDKYNEAVEKGEAEGMIKLFLFNYCSIEDDSTKIDAVEDKLHASKDLASGQLFHVLLEQNGSSYKNVANNTEDRRYDDVLDVLKELNNGKTWEEINEAK